MLYYIFRISRVGMMICSFFPLYFTLFEIGFDFSTLKKKFIPCRSKEMVVGALNVNSFLFLGLGFSVSFWLASVTWIHRGITTVSFVLRTNRGSWWSWKVRERSSRYFTLLLFNSAILPFDKAAKWYPFCHLTSSGILKCMKLLFSFFCQIWPNGGNFIWFSLTFIFERVILFYSSSIPIFIHFTCLSCCSWWMPLHYHPLGVYVSVSLCPCVCS